MTNLDDIELREKDVAVLQAIKDGAQTVSEIREATTLSTREINYSINEYSLETLGLIQVDRFQEREWNEFNNHQKNIWKPKQLNLTDKGIQQLAQLDHPEHKYGDMTHQELVERIHELENRLDRFENIFKDFRGKVMERI